MHEEPAPNHSNSKNSPHVSNFMAMDNFKANKHQKKVFKSTAVPTQPGLQIFLRAQEEQLKASTDKLTTEIKKRPPNSKIVDT